MRYDTLANTTSTNNVDIRYKYIIGNFQAIYKQPSHSCFTVLIHQRKHCILILTGLLHVGYKSEQVHVLLSQLPPKQ